MKLLIRNFILVICLVQFVAIIAHDSVVYADREAELKSIFEGTTHYDPNATGCTPSQTPVGVGNNPVRSGLIYILGDSITVQTEEKYKTLFEDSGYTTFINGSGGRAWSWGGSTATPQGSQKSGERAVLEDDTDEISQAAGIVIALGTNYGNSSNPIDEIITTFREINSDAPIWWVNTAITPEWTNDSENLVPALGEFNRFLEERSTGRYDVVDWFKAVNPSGDPTVTPTNDPGGLISDGIHPTNSGEDRLSNLVYSAVTGQQPGEVTEPTSPIATTSGTFSAIVWRTEQTMDPAWVPILGRAAQRFGVDPAMLAAIQSIETNWATPSSFANNPQRNSATATGPFQFLDGTAAEFMPVPDRHSTLQNPAAYTERVIRNLNNGTNTEPDGSLVLDGNKDGVIDRATPEDAALMAAAYIKSLGASISTPVGEEGDYAVPRGARNEQLTSRLVGAYYNQGPGFNAPTATSAAEVNARAAGRNDVAHYMDQMSEVTRKGRESGVFGGSYPPAGGLAQCNGEANIPATGDAAEYIENCAANGGNAEIACVAINELMGFPYSMELRAPPTDDPPEYLDCSAMVNMAIYRAFGNNLGGMCSAQFRTDSNFETIDIHEVQPGDLVGSGSACGGAGHIAIVVSYDPVEKKLITVETGSTRHPSGLRGIGGQHGYNVGFQADGNGNYEWAVRYIGPKTATN
jgi:hypothetical protein